MEIASEFVGGAAVSTASLKLATLLGLASGGWVIAVVGGAGIGIGSSLFGGWVGREAYKEVEKRFQDFKLVDVIDWIGF